jgi:hypothetical protein
MKKSKRATRVGRVVSARAFLCGLSGVGALVVHGKRVHALQPGDTIETAWSNVGRYLDGSFAKLANERKAAAKR